MTKAAQDIKDYIAAHREEMTALWRELVNIDSGTANREGVNAVCARLLAACEAAGISAEAIPFEGAGSTLSALWGAHNPGKPVLFMGHMDTVFPPGTAAARPFTINGDTVTGPGALDMKGGCVAALYAIRALAAAGYKARPVKYLISGDEETGHGGSESGHLFMDIGRDCAAAFNFETSVGPWRNVFVTGRKGSADIHLETFGVAAHSGNDYEAGRNAIMESMYKLDKIFALTDIPAGITLNPGVIKGGTVSNAVPDYCSTVINLRIKTVAQYEDIKNRVEAICQNTYIEGTRTAATFRMTLPPMETTEGVLRLLGHMDKVSQELGLGPAEGIYVGGGSDAAYTVMAGIPTLCACGVKGEHNHSDREYASLESLFQRAELAANAVLRLPEDF